MLLDQDLEPVKTQVRVGTAVDLVGPVLPSPSLVSQSFSYLRYQVGKPKAITGFQTHSSPVLLHFEQRAELATEVACPPLPPCSLHVTC